MLFRRFWILLLFCFIWQPLAAKQPTLHGVVYNGDMNYTPITENVPLHLSSKAAQDEFPTWISQLFLMPPQGLQQKHSMAPYLLYPEEIVDCMRLDERRARSIAVFAWEYRPNTFFRTAKYPILLNQLSFVPESNIPPYQLLTSQDWRSNLTHTQEAPIQMQVQQDNGDASDAQVDNKEGFPIRFGIDFSRFALSTTYDNLHGWKHILESRPLYNQGLGYSITYLTPNIKQTGITGELQYLYVPTKSIKRLHVSRDFTHQAIHAGKIEVNKTRKIKRRVLDGDTSPQKISFSFDYQCVWLGTTRMLRSSDDRHQIRLFLTGKVVRQHFTHRPTVTSSVNRYFHHYVFGVGSLGFSNKRCYEDRLVYGVGSTESIPYGSKVNLTYGYQFGEFANRPYLRLDIAQGGRIQRLGHLYGAIFIGGFYHKKAVEQGIIQLQLDYFTPLLAVGNQRIRQFVRLDYLQGHNMFTGELISTHLSKASAYWKDPFPGGTRRLYLDLETVLLAPRHYSSFQVAALGFATLVRLQDAQGRDQQSSFCKALGIGLRCAHLRIPSGTLQIKLGYSPLKQSKYFAIGIVVAPSNVLEIGEPKTIPFQEY